MTFMYMVQGMRFWYFLFAQDETVNVRLPRFRIEESTELKDALESLGIVDIFEPSLSDLTGMATGETVHVSDIFHKWV